MSQLNVQLKSQSTNMFHMSLKQRNHTKLNMLYTKKNITDMEEAQVADMVDMEEMAEDMVDMEVIMIIIMTHHNINNNINNKNNSMMMNKEAIHMVSLADIKLYRMWFWTDLPLALRDAFDAFYYHQHMQCELILRAQEREKKCWILS